MGKIRRQPPRQFDPVEGGEADIDQDQVGEELRHDPQGRLPVAGLTDHGESLRLFENAPGTRPQELVVVHHHHPAGNPSMNARVVVLRIRRRAGPR